MRAVLLITALGIVAGACGKTLTCKPGTALVTVQLVGDAVGADQLAIAVSTSDGKSGNQTTSIMPDRTSGTIEIDFAKYPRGQSLQITIIALKAGDAVGSGGVSVTLGSGCTALKLQVGLSSSDGGMDLSASVDDLSMPDLASTDALPDSAPADLAEADLVDLLVINPDLYQGVFCDGGAQCTSGFCAATPETTEVCCDKACNTPCVGAAKCRGGTCSAAPAGTAGCGAYVCDGVSPTCPSSCSNSSACSVGHCCNGASCVTSGGDTGCGASCTDCTKNTSTGLLHCFGTACGCSSNSDCGSGKYCDGTHSCQPCNIATECGSTCTNCTGNSNGSACFNGLTCGCNTAADCGSGKYCASTNLCRPWVNFGSSCMGSNACASTDPFCNPCVGTKDPNPSPCPISGPAPGICPNCYNDTECPSGDYCGKAGGNKVQCVPQIASGASCNDLNCMVPGCIMCATMPPGTPCPGMNCP